MSVVVLLMIGENIVELDNLGCSIISILDDDNLNGEIRRYVAGSTTTCVIEH